MLDINKHRFYLVQILKDIYGDIELANCLGFKGGTALMFFYELPRFSVDLDFNLLDKGKEKIVYEKVRKIVLKYGSIYDEALKFFGPLIVLNYGKEERKLKIEISKRTFNDRYEIKNLLGIDVKVMVSADMFAHKLCALLDRNTITNRDIFDSWFFMNNHTPVNTSIIQNRMNVSYTGYMDRCIRELEQLKKKNLLQGLGELVDEKIKTFVRNSLLSETIDLLKFYNKYPMTG